MPRCGMLEASSAPARPESGGVQPPGQSTAAEQARAQKRPHQQVRGVPRAFYLIWNGGEAIAQLLGTSGQVVAFTLAALPIIRSRWLLTVGLGGLQQVLHSAGDLMRRRHNCLFRPKSRTHRSLGGAK